MIQYLGSGRVKVELGEINGEFLESDLSELFYDLMNMDTETYSFRKGYSKGREDGYSEGKDESTEGFQQYDINDARDEGHDKGYDKGYRIGKSIMKREIIKKLSEISV